MYSKEITFDRFVRILGAILVCAIAYFLLLRLSHVLIPFLVAWLFAYMLYPMVMFFEKTCRFKSRVLSIIVTLLVVIGVITGFFFIVIPPAIDEFVQMKDIVINYVSSNKSVNYVSDEIEHFLKSYIDVNEISKMISFQDVSTFIDEKMPQVIGFLTNSVHAIIGFVGSFIALLYMFFILMDYEHLSDGFMRMIPEGRKREVVAMLLSDLEYNMNGYFRGQGLISLIVGILFCIGFLIIGLPLAIPLGILIGVLNMVPYMHTLGLVPAIFLALLKAHNTDGNFLTIMLGVLIVYGLIQILIDAVLTPRIMGHVTGLRAAVILLSLSIWGSLLGFVGLIIALPLTTIIVSYYKRFVLKDGPLTPEGGSLPDGSSAL